MTYDDRPWLKSYDEGVEPEVRIPSLSLVDLFEEVLRRYPQNPAVHFLGVTPNYKTFMGYANRIANALQQESCQVRDVVAIQLPNLPQYLIAQVGALKAGCTVSGLSPLLTPAEMAYQLSDCKAKVLVTLDALFENRLKEISDRLPELKLVISTGLLDFLPRIKRVN